MSTFKIALLWTLTGVAAAAPVLHHTDLDSGPPGAYVTVWGANFPSTPSLTAGGINVAAVSSSVGATGDTVLTFRIPANANSSGIIVNGSNTLPFVVRPGRIFYISTATGSNANDGLSDANVALGRGPWQDLSKITAMLPGDIVYLRGGTYTKILNTTYNANIHITKTASGLPGKPKAMVAYPGEIPVIGNGMNSRAISTFEGVTDWTFAKLTLKASSAGFHQTRGGNARIRFIGNSINGVNSSYGTVGLKGCTECKILGNHVWNSGKAGNKLAHLIYYGGYGVGANLQIAYNLLHDERGGRCIQVYGHTDADRLSELSIHDNIIYNCPYDGILVGSSDAVFKPWISAASIHHNIVYNSGGGIRINSSGVAAQVFNNTLHNNSVNLKFETAKTVNAYKNISSLPKSSHASIKIFPTMHGNGWWRGPAPAQGAGHIVSDPLFVNATAGDFRLQPESPMYGLGAIVPPLLPPLPLPPPPACVCP